MIAASRSKGSGRPPDRRQPQNSSVGARNGFRSVTICASPHSTHLAQYHEPRTQRARQLYDSSTAFPILQLLSEVAASAMGLQKKQPETGLNQSIGKDKPGGVP